MSLFETWKNHESPNSPRGDFTYAGSATTREARYMGAMVDLSIDWSAGTGRNARIVQRFKEVDKDAM